MRIDELLTVMTERRSVRRFSPGPVSDEEIRLLLEAARCAPSNSNRQAWKFLIVKNDAVKMRLADAVEKKIAATRAAITNPDLVAAFDSYSTYLTFFKDAPVVVAALSKHAPSFLERVSKDSEGNSARRTTHPELMSVAMAIQNMLLAAHALGLGSCCMTGPSIAADEIEAILDVRPPFELAALIPVGRYDELPPAPPRKDITRISEILE